MAYHKQNVTNTEALVALHVVPVADTTDDANMRDVVGKKEETGVVPTGEYLAASRLERHCGILGRVIEK